MNKLAKPLFLNTNISNFSYIKFHKDQSVINLTTDINLINYRFENNIKYKILFEKDLDNIELGKPQIYLWPNYADNEVLKFLHYYGISNGCNVYIANKNEIEVFSFAATNNDNSIQNFYINNASLLNRFIVYFKEDLQITLKNIKDEFKIKTDINFPIFSENSSNKNKYSDLSKELSTKKIHLSDEVYATTRELKCCALLLEGKSIKEIAKNYNLSYRTVESHINNTKNRLGITTKSSLIEFLKKRKWILDTTLNFD